MRHDRLERICTRRLQEESETVQEVEPHGWLMRPTGGLAHGEPRWPKAPLIGRATEWQRFCHPAFRGNGGF